MGLALKNVKAIPQVGFNIIYPLVSIAQYSIHSSACKKCMFSLTKGWHLCYLGILFRLISAEQLKIKPWNSGFFYGTYVQYMLILRMTHFPIHEDLWCSLCDIIGNHHEALT